MARLSGSITGALRWLNALAAARTPRRADARTTLLAALAIRLAGLVMLAYEAPLGWPDLTHPAVAALLIALAVAESIATAAIWLARGTVAGWWLGVDVGFGVFLLLASAAWHVGVFFTYAVLISMTLGLATERMLLAFGCGLIWAVAFVMGSMLPGGGPVIDAAFVAVPSFLANPVVGTLCAGLFRRANDEVAAARLAAMTAAASLATAREQARVARAMHDRALQTLEALSRGQALTDPAIRESVIEQAAWLRVFVETGRIDQDEDLATGLAAAARAIARNGVEVQLNDAGLRIDDPTDRLGAVTSQRVVEVVHQAMAAIGDAARIVVRAAPQRDGVLVTVLGSGGAPAPEPSELADVAARLAEVGGTVTVEPAPYIELWAPNAT